MKKEPGDDAAAFREDPTNLPGGGIPGANTPSGDGTQIGSRTVARILVVTDALPEGTPDPTLPSVRSDVSHSDVSHSDDTSSTSSADGASPANSNGTYNGSSGQGVSGQDIENIILSTQETSGERRETGVAASPLHFVNVLIEAGHVVSLITRHDWKVALLMASRDNRSPELIVVDAGRDTKELASLAELCRDIKESSAPCCASLLVALPATLPALRRGDRARDGAMPHLQGAGVDDFISAGALDCEILARVNALVQTARLRGELEATREHLRLHMQSDDVTRLLNRRFFFQAAHREYGRARRYNNELSCLMINIDFFKRFNAMFGYDCGDYVLRSVANILRDSTRDSDIVARFSEDKFVVMLPETPIDGAIAMSENIQRLIAENEFNWRGQSLPISVSVGEASRRTESDTIPVDAAVDDDDETVALSLREELAELLEEADAALFVAKRGVRSPFGRAESGLQSSRPAAPLPDIDSLGDLPTLLD
ncbi:MAG TPA: diguanylate cyclase [Abditibacteriaceae bacterium]|jgi:diguanylate cyclase (GGDEF)-like protein